MPIPDEMEDAELRSVIKRTFAEIDSDGFGVIRIEDMKPFQRVFEMTPDAFHSFLQFLKFFDKSGDGRFNLEELIETCVIYSLLMMLEESHVPELRREVIRLLFIALDEDGSQTLDKMELEYMVGMMADHCDVSKEVAMQAFDFGADKEEITLEEFIETFDFL
ncbi:hypothetical protein ADUPG1_008603 [Aduncisulcus paluster]|uniref:EF-hand domain-containing protein n=1 Tax=Aduncisulcus paluster TaxID=2918883 RepID=A0ABQ5KUX1_9EUKA|nr:hypothetical protein ADUPG1_008603 [Aduncisulcus paluster]